MKKYIIIFLIIALTLAAGYFVINNFKKPALGVQKQMNINNMFADASINELEVGKTVSVMGIKNSDESINAERVIISENMPADNQPTRRNGQMAEGNISKNLMTNIFGEIVKKEDNSIVLKIESGDSKIVYLSENTKISKAKK